MSTKRHLLLASILCCSSLAFAQRVSPQGGTITKVTPHAPLTGGGTAGAIDIYCPSCGGVSDGDKTDITVSAAGLTWLIDNGVVTLAKMADLANARILCRFTAGTGVPEACTGAQVATMLPAATTTTNGLVPNPGSATGLCLKDSLSWGACIATIAAGGVPQVTTVTGNTGDVTLNSDTTTLFVESANNVNLQALTGGYDGRKLTVVFALSAGVPTIIHNTGGTAANEILVPGNANWTLVGSPVVAVAGAELVYRAGSVNRWRMNATLRFPSLAVDGSASISGALTIQGGGQIINNGPLDQQGALSLRQVKSLEVTVTPSTTPLNDYVPPSGAANVGLLRMNASLAVTMTGYASAVSVGCVAANYGRYLLVHNVAAFDVTFSNQDGLSTTATDRFLFPNGESPTIHQYGFAYFICDSGSGRWENIFYTPAGSSSGKTWVYGDGSDGACNYDGVTTVGGSPPSSNIYGLGRDVMCTTVAVGAGVSVVPRGYHIFATGAVTINATGKITATGDNGTNGSTAIFGPGGWGGGPSGYGGSGVLNGGCSGGNGGYGSAANLATGQSCGWGTCNVGWPGPTAVTSGNGGTATGTGPAAPSGSTSNVAQGTYGSIHNILQALSYHSVANPFTPFDGGCGGAGGGGADGTSSNKCGGGGGGGGGGVIVITAPSFATTGTIEAKGGNGGNGVTGTGCVGGKGGGGTGGVVLLITPDATLPTISLTGGSAGTSGAGTATAGSNGYSLTFAPTGI